MQQIPVNPMEGEMEGASSIYFLEFTLLFLLLVVLAGLVLLLLRKRSKRDHS